MADATDYVPPHSLEAEKSTLGSLLVDKDSIVKISDFLKAEDFYNKKNLILHKYLQNRTRFYKNKSNYLIDLKNNYNYIARQLNKIKNPYKKRDFLIENVKGLGLKEASHFLRNIGYKNLAILDRHILKNLLKLKIIDEI